MEENPRLLWGYVETALRPRRAPGDPTWVATLNRLCREATRALGLPPGPALSRQGSAIANEHWSTEQVAAAPRAPASAEAAPQETPMIAVRLTEACVVIDGAGRAARIAADGRPGLHSVVVIAPGD